MRPDWTATFPLRPDLVMFNHASFGLATTELLARGEEIRRHLESDPDFELGEGLQERLARAQTEVCGELGLDARQCALTASATSAAAAVQQSLPLAAGQIVVSLSIEYSSVLRGWQRRCEEVGAELRVVDVDIPLPDEQALIAAMDAAVPEQVAILQVSAVSSSAALRLPILRIAEWGHERGAVVVVDAAHGPGHIPVAEWNEVDIAFGTLHKWLPVPRAVGILWAAPALADMIRPVEVSLTWDCETLAARFAWPGTFDPTARLCIPDALACGRLWAAMGEIARCEQLTDYMSAELSQVGADLTGGTDLLSPRLRAFLLRGVPVDILRARLLDASIRAWTGAYGETASLLRLATHVYNDEDDVELVVRQLAPLLRHRPMRR
ncbi:MAG: aminotransferase class V-fold PLP-dependent enzyme [Pseudonocardiaceae bacterium]